MACPLSKINDHFRVAVELYAASAPMLIDALTRLRTAGAIHADAHTAIDPDPVSLL